jgi:hypothetical protein
MKKTQPKIGNKRREFYYGSAHATKVQKLSVPLWWRPSVSHSEIVTFSLCQQYQHSLIERPKAGAENLHGTEVWF